MVGWHHQLNGHESEQTPVARDEQGSLACCGPWGCKELDTTERLNWLTELKRHIFLTLKFWFLEIYPLNLAKGLYRNMLKEGWTLVA